MWWAYEEALLALVIWREAAIDGEAGMRAVAHVVRNRVNDREFPNSFAEVIGQPWQFSAMTAKGDPMTIRWPKFKDESFARALLIAGEIYGGKGSPDTTGGALFYRNPKTATSEWFEKHIAQAPGYRRSCTIGHHDFYARVPAPDGGEAAARPELWGTG